MAFAHADGNVVERTTAAALKRLAEMLYGSDLCAVRAVQGSGVGCATDGVGGPLLAGLSPDAEQDGHRATRDHADEFWSIDTDCLSALLRCFVLCWESAASGQ